MAQDLSIQCCLCRLVPHEPLLLLGPSIRLWRFLGRLPGFLLSSSRQERMEKSKVEPNSVVTFQVLGIPLGSLETMRTLVPYLGVSKRARFFRTLQIGWCPGVLLLSLPNNSRACRIKHPLYVEFRGPLLRDCLPGLIPAS